MTAEHVMNTFGMTQPRPLAFAPTSRGFVTQRALDGALFAVSCIPIACLIAITSHARWVRDGPPVLAVVLLFVLSWPVLAWSAVKRGRWLLAWTAAAILVAALVGAARLDM